MQDGRQTLLYAAVFLVVAVVMLSLQDITEGLPQNEDGFGPGARPFACDFIREGAGPDDMQGRFTLASDTNPAGPFPHCATLTRGTDQHLPWHLHGGVMRNLLAMIPVARPDLATGVIGPVIANCTLGNHLLVLSPCEIPQSAPVKAGSPWIS